MLTPTMCPCYPWLAALIFLCAGTARLSAEPPTLPPDAFDHLPPHPRLYADAARWNALRGQIHSDPASVRLYAAVMHEADDLLKRPPVVFEKIGPRLLDSVRDARERIITLAAAARLTGNPRYRDRAVAEMRDLANLPNWNPSHFLDTAEATQGLATGYDWLYNDLTPADRTLFEDAIISHGLDASLPASGADPDYTKGGNNWNAVCNGGLVAGALAVAERDPAKARHVVERAARNLHFFAQSWGPDGAFPEGTNYWAFAGTYQVLLVDELRTALGTSLDLEKFPGFLTSVDYRQQMIGPTGKFFDYGDSGEGVYFTSILFWFARELHRPDLWKSELARLPAPEAAAGNLCALALVWRDPAADNQPAAAPRTTRWLGRGQVPVVALRSALDDPKAVFVAFKAGSPSASHAHMDVGGFVMEADGVRWAVDPGKEDYNFVESSGGKLGDLAGGGRFDVFLIGPDAHNILRFGSTRQRTASRAAFSASRLTGANPFVVADLTDTYKDQVVSVHRGVCLRDDRRVLLRDEWTAGPIEGIPWNVAWQWLTRAQAEADATGATLRDGGKTLRLRVLAPAKFTVAVEDASQPVHPYDAPNPGLKRIVVRTDLLAGKVAVLAEPGSATGTLLNGEGVKPLADW